MTDTNNGPSPRQHILEARNVEFAYHADAQVLRGVSFTAAADKLACVLGPNGSGKTTLLRCLLGQLGPQAGSILLDGKELSRYSRRGLARMMAYVPQLPQSAFPFTVRELVLMGRYPRSGVLGMTGEQDRKVAELAMKMTDTTAFASRTLDELSGGEAQCAMIARALAQQPQVCLLDEPTSHLDIANQLKIYRMMRRLAHDWKMAVVCVSHDVNLAARFADELTLMRDGQVVASGPPTQVVRRDVLRQTYGVDVELIASGEGEVPLVVAH
ncbi:MAG: ABC transporter ATP-binding protein [Phycisphaerae bacterium]